MVAGAPGDRGQHAVRPVEQDQDLEEGFATTPLQ